jgi:sarcosine oxidase subunit gamma
MAEVSEPGAAVAGAAPGTGFAEAPLAGLVSLRGAFDDPKFARRAAQAIGMDLVTEPNRLAGSAALWCIWQGPDEWLLVVPIGEEQRLVERLEAELAGLHCAIVDVTGGFRVLRLDGEATLTLLSMGCSLDFDPRAFPPGSAVRTLLAGVPLSVLRVEDRMRFDLVVPRSFTHYLQGWLARAAQSADAP